MKIIAIIMFGWTLLVGSAALAQERVSVNSEGITTLDPPSIYRPDRYSHGKLVPMDAQMLFTAGQVGADQNGDYADGIEAQADQAFKNLYAVVKAAGMGAENVLKITMFYLKREDIGTIIAARDKYFGEGFRPNSTALVVASLAGPQILVEVEAIAAKVR
ncbi:MAG: RidA family protein [Kordiimonadaceae bacterium]|jgi:2-iminobutanoate/2-iminopropanoate deaminase|nr:RidA family protein [Kordiimonadaceae bacterium]